MVAMKCSKSFHHLQKKVLNTRLTHQAKWNAVQLKYQSSQNPSKGLA